MNLQDDTPELETCPYCGIKAEMVCEQASMATHSGWLNDLGVTERKKPDDTEGGSID